ncbi:MAG: hypothetical protein ACTSUN_11685 [Promethearchaeota archaeon]
MLNKELENLIDKAVSRDFIIYEISEKDKITDSYKALQFTLTFNNIAIEYQRKVESERFPVIPQFQFLFGFYPRDGLCLFVNKQEHKKALCDGPLEQINKSCVLIHSLMYLLVPSDRFEVYSYLPACCELNCPNSPKQYNLRIKLFEKV